MRLVAGFGRAIFPHFCVSCGLEGQLFCSNCEVARYAPNRGFFFCLGCGCRLKHQVSCGRASCVAGQWGRGFAAGSYGDPILRGLLHLYKYEQVEEAGKILIDFLATTVGRQVAAVLVGISCSTVVPIPMHPVGRAWRGFNQAEELARAVSTELETDFLPSGLARRLSWQPQAKISDHNRRVGHVSGMFKSGTDGIDLVRREVILVDDVFTTGATMRECIRTLHLIGVETVSAIVLLKG
ncbi:hypothetical protein A2480_03585 [Candidatus Uhrbacteria bacterium RIFOXYC2_FULL_47_19]|uniref:Phosphoribosyltransferase domain-containing protein n=1 Tax=Candidatus Uhrbacteria bacterium RIFOXYC2_FULL_47_19 TaxID=1802424 RepID=A0A1F7WBD3_9BACT|nr:MAG: hypothetical protein A2480_03585 [Candidatus Uhrbacteria bacterium RIFOXYC2_FULL_47_19]